MVFKDVAANYIEDPDPARLLELRVAIQACVSYTPTPPFLPEAVRLADAGRHGAVVELLAQWMPGAFLSPAAHSMLSQSLRALGDAEAADREEYLATLAVMSIWHSGDGSRNHPWVVLRVTDEYDLLRWAGRRAVGQRAERSGARFLDCITCEDGSEAWFELFRAGRGETVAA